MARDWRDDRIEELERENAQLRAHVQELQALVTTLRQTVTAQERRIQDLEAKLGQSSGNSSRPPSSDPPGTSPPARPTRTGRKRGGQPGHAKHSRTLVPPEQVDRVHVLKPCACRHCFHPLVGDDPSPYRHQVIERPPSKATVEEFQLHTLICKHCGTSTRATLPAGVPTGQFGPRLQATIAVCTGDYKLSKRETERLLNDFFGVPIALGSVINLEHATSKALATPVEEVAQAIRKEPVVHADETGWYERGKRAWMWAAVTASLALFLVRKSRGTDVAKELLGAAFAGILVSDRWSAYAWVDVSRRQICWSHLKRQFIGFQAYGADACAIGEALELLTEMMFSAWHRVRDGTMTQTAFRQLMESLRGHVAARLQEGASCSIKEVSGRCREILALESALWTFVEEKGVEPTNNAAEQIVRPGVLWRKKSFGTDSPNGSRFVERILTAGMTLRLQKRNVIDYITEACEAALQGKAAPSLLPS